MAVTLSILKRFSIFFTVRFCIKFADTGKKTHMRRYTTLRSCETLMSENARQSQTNAVINDKLQGTVVTYLGCGGISITNLRQVYC